MQLPTWNAQAVRNSVWEGLLGHQRVKIVQRHLTVGVGVRTRDHFLQVLHWQVFPELPGDSLKIPRRDAARAVVVKEAEHLGDILSRISLAHLCRHQVDKPPKVQGLRTLPFQVAEHVLHNLIPPQVQSLHAASEVARVDALGAINVEEIERFLHLFDLILRQAWPLVPLPIEPDR
eukprot:CAMPEP_0175717000 /NCGR_PEP_ID=MMETSP0097-20121207/43436_1 /TAXON_ID=311494 /ORGANISM="Alexandrium monilatum, Strain CCMP3105" /LENGTH=175 /DNA_ID=CAMNT_0017024565 /DNA_START=9 /DNA_END=533 /DNA_ORIENTATION=-